MKKLLFFVFVAILSVSLFAVNFDVNKYTLDELKEIRSIINLKLSDLEKGSLIYEDDYISVSFLGWKSSILHDAELWISVTNKSNINLTVQARQTSVNDYSISHYKCSGSIGIAAGKKTNNYILYFTQSTLNEQWIDKIEYVEFAISYYDTDDLWNGYSFTTAETFIVEDSV